MREARPVLFDRREFTGLALLGLHRSFSEGACILFEAMSKSMKPLAKVNSSAKKVFPKIWEGSKSFMQPLFEKTGLFIVPFRP